MCGMVCGEGDEGLVGRGEGGIEGRMAEYAREREVKDGRGKVSRGGTGGFQG